MKNNELYKRDLKLFIADQHTAEFLYKVGTNEFNLDTNPIQKYNGNIKQTIIELIELNPQSQFAKEFHNLVEMSFNDLMNLNKEHILKELKTHSEKGSVKIGNTDFEILIPNGYGDCKSDVYIVEMEDVPANYLTTIKGDFSIFEEDMPFMENVVIEKLQGTYEIYNSFNTDNGVVVFNKRKGVRENE